jgi:hypothetical protein
VSEFRGVLSGVSLSNLLSCGQPVGAMVAAENETTDVVRKTECGIVVRPRNVANIRSAVLCLKGNTFVCGSMGHNGRSCLEKNVSIYERDLLCPCWGWDPYEEVDFFKERECAGSWALWVVNILTWVKSQDSAHILMSNLMTCSQWFAATITGESGPAIMN